MGAGYSGTPLWKKLGIRADQTIAVVNAPSNYEELLQPLPDGVTIKHTPSEGDAFLHLFTRSRSDLEKALRKYRKSLDPSGVVWVSWPKKAAKVPTDLTEDVIRSAALPLGFVDVKVCAVDEIWSGLKLVVRVVLR